MKSKLNEIVTKLRGSGTKCLLKQQQQITLLDLMEFRVLEAIRFTRVAGLGCWGQWNNLLAETNSYGFGFMVSYHFKHS